MQDGKLDFAEKLRKQGLKYYTLYDPEDKLPKETEEVKWCYLNQLNSKFNPQELQEEINCAECKMKCYLVDCDSVAIVRK